jgi:DtxR family Mn-dependent transcriptional regulator
MKHEPFNESTEMYLKTVRELAQEDNVVPISALAKRLGVSTVSATEMVHRLQDQGLLQHVPYRGISLTEDGQQRAIAITRAHRLWERFLADQLQLPWEDVHDIACRLEHATDNVVTEALAAFLQNPVHCPHGNPIPAADGTILPEESIPLHTLSAGQSATVTAIRPESSELLGYLASLGLKPGAELCIQEIAPFNGPLMVRIDDDQVHALGQEVSQHVFVAVHQ